MGPDRVQFPGPKMGCPPLHLAPVSGNIIAGTCAHGYKATQRLTNTCNLKLLLKF